MTKPVKARPAVLRALGHREPPAEVYIDGEIFRRTEIYKHDSWAATAMYEGPRYGVVCKFNRMQSIGPLPTTWIGRFLARREGFAYARLADVDGIIQGCGPVRVEGEHWNTAVAHIFMPGHPLGAQEQVNDEFFPGLLRTLQAVHERGFAYVDLHKRENILVGEDDKAYLIDFQISYFAAPRSLLAPLSRPFLRILQKSDLYHLAKHVRRLRPDQLEELGLLQIAQRPWWIRAHRLVAVPFREGRRKLLTWLGVRGPSGRSATETFAEHAFRCEQNQTDQSSKAA